jgi:hypothetical protein
LAFILLCAAFHFGLYFLDPFCDRCLDRFSLVQRVNQNQGFLRFNFAYGLGRFLRVELHGRYRLYDVVRRRYELKNASFCGNGYNDTLRLIFANLGRFCGFGGLFFECLYFYLEEFVFFLQ